MVVLELVLMIVAGYFCMRWHYSYWKRRGLYQIQPTFVYGNLKEIIFGKIGYGEYFKNTYTQLKSIGLKHGGIYELFKPTYVPTDLDIIKNILQKDFNHFLGHGVNVNEEIDPIRANLFTLEGERWKKLRTKLSPVFTRGKVKMTLPTIAHCTEGLKEILLDLAERRETVNITDLIMRLTIDIVGSAFFGTDCNTLKDPNSIFSKFKRRMFKANILGRLKRMIVTTFPKWLVRLLGLKTFDSDTEEFIIGLMKSTVENREKNKIFRKDFLHFLLQLKKKDNEEDIQPIKDKSSSQFLSSNEILAESLIFFAGGFETTASTITFALLELAINLHIQKKLKNEIEHVLQNYNNQITYEAIMEMAYLEKVVNETLRKHPPVPITTRICNATYKIPNTDIIVEKGVRVIIPILGIHRDAEFYPEPDVFDPERFCDENKVKRNQYSFLPFGEGPRICIGSQFALLTVKIAITTIIKDFSLTLNTKTKIPITYAPDDALLDVEGDVWLNIQKE